MLIKKDPDIIRTYCEDASNIKGGHADELVFPASTEEVSQILREAGRSLLPVTVSGGGTGTTGGRVPFGGIVMSMERLDRMIELSSQRMSAAVQAGFLVEELQKLGQDNGLFYTSHPTEKTATIGGTVATNASGARSFKYGPTRKYVRRLKMVLADGSIVELRRGERFITKADHLFKVRDGLVIDIPLPSYRMPDIKNSAGYYAKDGMDLIDLFIGQEGTLSIITEVELGLIKKPYRIFSCFLFFRTEEESWDFAAAVRDAARSKALSASSGLDVLSIEYFDHNALKFLKMKHEDMPESSAALFIELELHEDSADGELDKWLAFIEDRKIPLDNTWAAMNEAEAQKFSEFRYAIPDTINDIVRRNGFQKLSTDIAVPDHKFLEMMRFYVDTLKQEDLEHVIFGHIGESHVHLNLLPRNESELERSRRICLEFAGKGVKLGGTVSAEHGIGKTRHAYLEEMYGASGILEMARIKKAFDPAGILGPGNIFAGEKGNF